MFRSSGLIEILKKSRKQILNYYFVEFESLYLSRETTFFFFSFFFLTILPNNSSKFLLSLVSSSFTLVSVYTLVSVFIWLSRYIQWCVCVLCKYWRIDSAVNTIWFIDFSLFFWFFYTVFGYCCFVGWFSKLSRWV